MRRVLFVCCALLMVREATAARVDTVFVTSDGVSLALSYYVPTTAPPAHGYPAILCVHGFGGSKNDYAGAASGYASHGYFVVAYTVRGQGVNAPAGNQSGGLFNWLTGDREIRDVAEILAWMRSRPDVDSNHVGMEGMSQGGLTTWGAAVKHLPIACAVPIIADPNYAEFVTPNGCFDYTFVLLMNAAEQQNSVHLGPYLTDTLIPAMAADQYDSVLRMMQRRDLGAKISGIKVPVYVQCAWLDQIFGSSSVLNAYDSIRTPKKLLMWTSGHGLGGGIAEAYRQSQVLRFYDRWLRGNVADGVMDPDSTVGMFDPSNTQLTVMPDSTLHKNLAEPVLTARYFLTTNGALSPTPPQKSLLISSVYVQNISNDLSWVFDSPPFDSDLTIFQYGTQLQVNSTGLRYQANAMLWDVDDTGAAVAVTRGCYEVRTATTGWRTIAYSLNPVLHTFRKGHKLRMLVKFGMPLFSSSDEFGQTPLAPQESATDSLRSRPQSYSYVVLSEYEHTTPFDTTSDVRSEMPIKEPAGSLVVNIGTPIPVLGNAVLYNDIGSIVSRSDANLQVPTMHLTAGIYFLRTTSATGGTIVQKVLIQRDH